MSHGVSILPPAEGSSVSCLVMSVVKPWSEELVRANDSRKKGKSCESDIGRRL